MDENMASSTSTLEAPLKTDRPLSSMAPAQVQVEQAEIDLHGLREEKGVLFDTLGNHCRVFSPFQNLPEDLLRKICVTCLHGDIPELSYGSTTMPYILSHICSGMRYVVLTTPHLWATMHVNFGLIPINRMRSEAQIYTILAQRTIEWLERAGELALTVIIQETNPYASYYSGVSDPAKILFDTLLSYSTRWKELQFISHGPGFPLSMIRIAALTAADVPLLESVSLVMHDRVLDRALRNSELLKIPTLRHVTLEGSVKLATVNWAVLTSVTLRGNTENEIGRILQETKYLEICRIDVRRSDEHYFRDINLPFLKTLVVTDETRHSSSYSILEAITAPILEIFENYIQFFDPSLSDFLKRSPRIWSLSFRCFDKDIFLTGTMELLRHCPSLVILTFTASGWCGVTRNADRFLRAFVEEDNNGVICPRLRNFTFMGDSDFSLETLRVFLDGKQRDVSGLNVVPWTKVVIDISGVQPDKKRRGIEDLVSTKQAMGLDVAVCAFLIGFMG